MREVGGPDHAVRVEMAAQLDADAVVLEAPVAVLADVLAGEALQRLDVQEPLGPGIVAVVAGVVHFEEERNPTDLVLCEVDAQLGEAVEDAAVDELHGVDGPQAAELWVGDLLDDAVYTGAAARAQL